MNGDVLKIRDEYRQVQWAAAIQECRASGLTNKEYCIQHGPSEKSFYYRQKKLRTQIVDAVPEQVDMDAVAALLRSIQSL